MPSLYLRKPYWWISLTNKESLLLNRSKGFSTNLKNKRQAELLLKEIKEQIILIKNKVEITNIPAGKILFSSVLNMYIEHKKNLGQELSDKTIEIYKKAIKHFNKALPDKLVSTYTKEDYNTFVKEMSEISQNSKAIYTARIKALFAFLVKEDYINKNNFRTVKEEMKKNEIITEKQLNDFLEYTKKTKFYDRVMLMKIGAFRASEALSIRQENIKSDRIELKGKGGKIAAIPIINEMKEFLESGPDLDLEMNYQSIRQYFKRASKKLNINIHSHDLRKIQLSKMANAGINIFTVKNYARHSDVKTTLKYYAKADLMEMKNEIDTKITTMVTTIN